MDIGYCPKRGHGQRSWCSANLHAYCSKCSPNCLECARSSRPPPRSREKGQGSASGSTPPRAVDSKSARAYVSEGHAKKSPKVSTTAVVRACDDEDETPRAHKEWALGKLTRIRTDLKGYTNRDAADYGGTVGNVSCGRWEYRASASTKVVPLDSDVSGNPHKAGLAWYRDGEARRNNTNRAPQSEYEDAHQKCSEIRTLERAQQVWHREIARASRPQPITLRIYSENMPCWFCRNERLGPFVNEFVIATIVVYYRNRRGDDETKVWDDARGSDDWYEHVLWTPQTPDAEPEKESKEYDGWKDASEQSSKTRKRAELGNVRANEAARQRASEDKESTDWLKQHAVSHGVVQAIRYYRANDHKDAPYVQEFRTRDKEVYARLKDSKNFDPDGK